MKKFLIALLLASACGSDDDEPDPEPRYAYNLTCTATCDGVTETVSQIACSTQAEAQQAVDEIVADCEAQLAPECATYACDCASQDNPPLCE